MNREKKLVDLSSIKEKQNRKEKKQILSRPSTEPKRLCPLKKVCTLPVAQPTAGHCVKEQYTASSIYVHVSGNMQ